MGRKARAGLKGSQGAKPDYSDKWADYETVVTYRSKQAKHPTTRLRDVWPTNGHGGRIKPKVM